MHARNCKLEYKSSAVAEMGDSLATIDMARKVGGGGAAVPLSVRDLSPQLCNVAWAEAYIRAKWYPDPSSRLATIDMGRGLCGRRTQGIRKP